MDCSRRYFPYIKPCCGNILLGFNFCVHFRRDANTKINVEKQRKARCLVQCPSMGFVRGNKSTRKTIRNSLHTSSENQIGTKLEKLLYKKMLF